MEPFKNIYNKDSVRELAKIIAQETPLFKKSMFEKDIFESLNSLEMKDRVRLIADKFAQYSHATYSENLTTITNCIKNGNLNGFILWPFSQYIEKYGLNQNKSLKKTFKALELITKNFTSEFAIRDYINNYPEDSFQFLLKCAVSPNEHLRRFASEGSRPSLPWGKKITNITQLKKFSSKLLELLKNDKSEYVQKSVANHLNDYNHIDSSYSLKILAKWKKENVPLKTIRHALRTLLKNGNQDALNILDYSAPNEIIAKIVELDRNEIFDGEDIKMKVQIKNKENSPQKLLIDYIIHYPKKNGRYTKKVFRLKDFVIKEDNVEIIKQVSFKSVTVRKHYPGIYYIELQINGKIFNRKSFKINEKD